MSDQLIGSRTPTSLAAVQVPDKDKAKPLERIITARRSAYRTLVQGSRQTVLKVQGTNKTVSKS